MTSRCRSSTLDGQCCSCGGNYILDLIFSLDFPVVYLRFALAKRIDGLPAALPLLPPATGWHPVKLRSDSTLSLGRLLASPAGISWRRRPRLLSPHFYSPFHASHSAEDDFIAWLFALECTRVLHWRSQSAYRQYLSVCPSICRSSPLPRPGAGTRFRGQY